MKAGTGHLLVDALDLIRNMDKLRLLHQVERATGRRLTTTTDLHACVDAIDALTVTQHIHQGRPL